MARIPRRLAGIGASDIPNEAAFDAYVGPSREVTVDPTRGLVRLHDGSTPGGKPVGNERIPDGGIRAADFGVGPDAGNNAEILNEMVGDLASSGGGAIYLPATAIPLAAELTLRSRVHFVGKGPRVSVFERADGYNGDLLKTLDFDTLNAGNTAGGPNRFGLHNLSINGRKDEVTSATGWNLRIYGRAYSIQQVESEYCAAGGFYSRWGATAAAWDDDPTDSRMEANIDGLHIQFSKGEPVFDGPHDSQIGKMVVAMSGHGVVAPNGSSNLILGPRAAGTEIGLLHVWGDGADWCVSNYADGLTMNDLVVDDARASNGGGLLRQIGSNCFIRGKGLQFGTDGLNGIQIGETGTAAIGNKIIMHFTTTPASVLLFGNDGGNDIDITVNAPTTTVNITGTRHPSTTLSYTERGPGAGANDFLREFGALTINKQTIRLAARSGTPDDVPWENGMIYPDETLGKLRMYIGGQWRTFAFEP
jgi:hypothetical protein